MTRIREVCEVRTLTLGTRGSLLARTQSEHVRQAILATGAVDSVDVTVISTRGDRILDVPLAKVGGKGLFVKEIEEALLDGRIDFAVHSLKDMPVEQPEGLVFGAIPEREDPRDVLVFRAVSTVEALPNNPVIGTSSLRRAAQVRALVEGAKVVNLRGNVDTRIHKLHNQTDPALDGILLAAAGLKRLDKMTGLDAIALDPQRFLPAVGQGALAVECRSDDDFVLGCLRQIHHEETAAQVRAERAFLAGVEGSCQIPVAGHATLSGDTLTLDALISSLSGDRVVRGQHSGSVADAAMIGATLAQSLLERGGAELLAECLAEQSS